MPRHATASCACPAPPLLEPLTPGWGERHATPYGGPGTKLGQYREIIAALMCSRMYFELELSERLALVKSLCGYQGASSVLASQPA